MSPEVPRAVPAAGTVPWRVRDGHLEVALVHRPRYDDWSWPKGKLDPGEQWPVAAARETLEETGLVVALGRSLPTSTYLVLDRSGQPSHKEVRYWTAQVTGGTGVLENEIDAVAWLEAAEAHTRLDYARDRDQLRAVVRAHQEQSLDTWPLVLVRHAKALPRNSWTGEDWHRPLVPEGIERAVELAPVLHAYGVRRLETSSATRCVQTLEPAALHLGRRLRHRDDLTEESYAVDPDAAYARLDRLLDRGRPVAVSTHGPLLPDLLGRLAERVHRDAEAAAAFDEAADLGLDKGDALVLHVNGRGPGARIVAADWHQVR